MDITIYTKKNCQPCRLTKKKLEQLEIPYEEISLEEDLVAAEAVRTMGFSSAPVVITSTGVSWSGYRPDLIESLLEICDTGRY